MSVIGICFIWFAVLLSQAGFVSIWSNNYGDDTLRFFINAIVASLFLFTICLYLPKRKFSEILSQGTFMILGLHSIIITISRFVLTKIGVNGLLQPWIVGFITLIFFYIPIKYSLKQLKILLAK